MKTVLFIFATLFVSGISHADGEATLKKQWECHVEGQDSNNLRFPFVAYGKTADEADRKAHLKCASAGYVMCRSTGCFNF